MFVVTTELQIQLPGIFCCGWPINIWGLGGSSHGAQGLNTQQRVAGEGGDFCSSLSNKVASWVCAVQAPAWFDNGVARPHKHDRAFSPKAVPACSAKYFLGYSGLFGVVKESPKVKEVESEIGLFFCWRMFGSRTLHANLV